jgi:hypothetical protein
MFSQFTKPTAGGSRDGRCGSDNLSSFASLRLCVRPAGRLCARPADARRGVLLLLILALLSMFGLMAVAFVVITGQAQRSAKSIERIDQTDEPPRGAQQLLQQAAMQIFRGSNNTASVMGAHSLLETMYGSSPSVTGTITGATGLGGGQVQLNTSLPGVGVNTAAWIGWKLTITNSSTCSGQSVYIAGVDTNGNFVASQFAGGALPNANDAFVITQTARITGPVPAVNPCGGQLTEITTNLPLAERLRRIGCVATITGSYNTLTCQSGPTAAYGQSTRIVGYNPNTGDLHLLTYADGTSLTPIAYGAGQVQVEFMISGPPFSGPGFGYDPLNRNLGTTYRYTDPAGLLGYFDWLVALLPNMPLSSYYNAVTNPLSNPPGGVNSDYTAADFQHMLVWGQAPDAAGVVRTLPSLHRPDLVNYWYHWLYNSIGWPTTLTNPEDTKWRTILQPYGPDYKRGTADDPFSDPKYPAITELIVALKRKILMRPLPEDHPNFNGSNPSSRQLLPPTGPASLFDTTATPNDVRQFWERGDLSIFNGQWDVDNDGDGLADSVWVDLGMPVRATTDGRLYKPLFAVLCMDLDGRLNVNAHGCPAQLTPAITPPANHGFAVSTPGSLPFGLGYGPAEINLLPVLSNDTTLYTQLLNWRYPVLPTTWPIDAAHLLSLNKWFLYGGAYWNASDSSQVNSTVNKLGAYGSPPDLLGTAAVGLDWGGKPLYVNTGQGQVYDDASATSARSPYESDLSANRLRGSTSTPGNRPFSAAELERILRPYDRDATLLPARLAQATATSGLPQDSVLLAGRNAVTTDSWDVPSLLPAPPATAVLDIVNDTAGGGANAFPAILKTALLSASKLNGEQPFDLLDLFRVKLAQRIWYQPPYSCKQSLTQSEVDTILNGTGGVGGVNNQLPNLVAPEVLAGREMDLNRAFGNGRDDAGNGVVDQPQPAEASDQVSLDSSASGTSTGVNVSYDPRGAVSGAATTSLQARQYYARYLYVMACLLVDRTNLRTRMQTLLNMTTLPTEDDAARFLAQWAVNVVDFYDRDSIMTPFDYDPNFAHDNPTTSGGITGWNPPGVPYRVWGCERPELLLTETLALHDRRTQDLGNEIVDPSNQNSGRHTGSGTTGSASPNQDPNFDQPKKPQGSLFIELYNPWGDQQPLPRELSNATGTGVDLSKVVTGTTCPVWRMLIVDNANAAADPDPDSGAATAGVLRSIYFADPTSAGLSGDGERFYTTTATTAIQPGRYAVIGSADSTTADTTYLGRLASASGTVEPSDNNQTRQIRLTSDAIGGKGTPVRNNKLGGDVDVNDSDIQASVTIPIHTPRRLNVSDPTGGYANTGPQGETFDATTGNYSTPLDVPLDYGALGRDATIAAAVITRGTTANVAVVHLQRLANPLMAWNAVSNPYRTIDTMPIDLVAFNGWEDESGEVTRHQLTDGTMMVASHQRADIAPTTPAVNSPWALSLVDNHGNLVAKTLTATCQESLLPATPAPPAAHVFPYVLHHTLGFMNQSLGFPDFTTPLARRTTTPNLGDPTGTGASPPFPWLTWNNRPFTSQLELLQVPWTKSSQLPRFFDLPLGDPYGALGQPFRHLPSFFEPTSQLYRVLEYVNVPSRFVSSETQIDPTNAAAAGTAHMFHPPFNRIPSYREPGRINLNTIFSETVYNGLMYSCFGAAPRPSWADFQLSRRGTDYVANPNTYPTMFTRPFRSFAGARLAPLANLQMIPPTTPEVNATLLRAHPTTASQALFDFTSTNTCNDPNRNPFFYYQSLQRLGNLVTTRSNVYAVWITVGYFEVSPRPTDRLDASGTLWTTAMYNAVYPDGYQLGRELGSDTGEVERHRAFYIFDRTVPVGFQRGSDLNVEKAILVNRYIE